MTVLEFQARNIERMAASMAHFVATTDASRLLWQPIANENSKATSVLDQVGECVVINRLFAAVLRGESPDPAPLKDLPEIRDSEDAQRQLTESGAELAAAVRGLCEEDLHRIFPHWIRPLPGAVVIEMPYRNMAYHAGQINYIQLLAGDTTFHRPPQWLD